MYTTFHNYTDHDLADAIGTLDGQAKEIGDRLKAAKAEFIRRGLREQDTGRFRITASEGVRQSLDTALVKQRYGEEWYRRHCRQTTAVSVRVAASRQPMEVAAE